MRLDHLGGTWRGACLIMCLMCRNACSICARNCSIVQIQLTAANISGDSLSQGVRKRWGRGFVEISPRTDPSWFIGVTPLFTPFAQPQNVLRQVCSFFTAPCTKIREIASILLHNAAGARAHAGQCRRRLDPSLVASRTRQRAIGLCRDACRGPTLLPPEPLPGCFGLWWQWWCGRGCGHACNGWARIRPWSISHVPGTHLCSRERTAEQCGLTGASHHLECCPSKAAE